MALRTSLLCIFFTVVVFHLPAQTNFFGELRLGFLPYDFVTDQASNLKKEKLTIIPTLRIDHRISYRYIVSTGISYWKIGYETKGGAGLEFLYPEIADKQQISNRWVHAMISIPLTIGWSPRFGGGHDLGSFSVSAGAEVNITQKSVLRDLKNFSTPLTYYQTDITKSVRPAFLCPTTTFYIQKRKLGFIIKYLFSPGGNLYSYKAAERADLTAEAVNAYYRSYYSFGKATKPFYQLYPTVFWGISYKLF